MEPLEAVDQALVVANARLAEVPSFTAYQSIQAQLVYLRKVLDGSELNRSRLRDINFGAFTAKEFAAADPEFARALEPAFAVATRLAKNI